MWRAQIISGRSGARCRRGGRVRGINRSEVKRHDKEMGGAQKVGEARTEATRVLEAASYIVSGPCASTHLYLDPS